jgi:predicted transcriptional regulator
MKVDMLGVEARRRVYRHVQDYPGLHLRELARAARLDPNHAKYHLAYLERHGWVSSRREDGYWRFWPRTEGSVGWREQVPLEDKEPLCLLRRPAPLHAVLCLLERGTMPHAQLRQAVGVASSTLHYHMRQLEAQGLVASRRDGRERHYRLVDPERVRDLLRRYRPPRPLMARCGSAWLQAGLPGR